ncbi:MAG TPA: cytochrome c oxidase subunit II [Solirubrobacteraceae bacterium]|nr:cytochrome c oxidase subunit II [Solirubrobacteraceae bacterium]
MRNRPVLQMVVIGVIACAIGIPVALAVPWFPSDASRQAHNIHTLYDVLLIASVPVFVLVETVVLFSVWKFRMRPGQEEMDGPPIHGNTRLEVVWTAVPAILIVALCTYAYTVLRSNENSKSNEMTVNVTARQFAFEFSYPTGPGKQVVSPVLYLPEGRPVVFKLHALDVIHSFFVPNFSEKLDAVPGITTTVRVTPTRLGSYPVECTELCGAGHSLMRAAVRVVSPETFQKWLSSQKPNGPPPVGTPPPNAAQPGVPGAASAAASSSSSSSSGSSTASQTSAAAGKAVFTGSAGCGSCHTLAAAGTTGTVGPNLGTSIVPDAKKAGMPVKAFTMDSILKPNSFIAPGYGPNVMPQTFGQTLTPTQVQALVNFISSVTK